MTDMTRTPKSLEVFPPAPAEFTCVNCGRDFWETERPAHERRHSTTVKDEAWHNPLASKSRVFDVQIVSTEVRVTTVLADDAYQAMGLALALARPGEDDVVILTWVNPAGESRELTVKVLVRR